MDPSTTHIATDERTAPLTVDAFEDLVDTAFDLLAVLEEETALLHATRVRDAVALAGRKSGLAATYDTLARRLKAHGIPDDASEEALDDLADVAGRLEGITAENVAAMQAVMTANQRLIDLVVNATRRAQADSGPATYTDKGRSASRVQPGAPAALDQAL